jgi:hypothetical protein
MKTQEKAEQEIKLIELFWEILFAWRQVFCLAIIIAILVSGMKYLFDNRAYRIAQNGEIEQEAEFTAEEEEQIEEARIMMKRIEDYQKYLNESALMQIDPYEKPVVELQYYVESDYTYNYTRDNQLDYTVNLMALYSNYVKSGEMSDKVIEAANLSVSQADFSELCSVSQNGTTMSITIAWAEVEKLDKISELIKAELKQKEIDFQEIGSHKLKLLRESQNVIADIELAEKKNTFSNNIVYINTQLSALKASMSEQQLKSLRSEGGLENRDDGIEIVKPVFSKKYFLLGAFLGMLLVCVWTISKIFFATKLQSPEEIRAFYNMRLLGEITIQSEKKRFLSVIDDKLLAIKNRRKKKLSMEQQIKVTAANIVLSCRRQGIDCIYMTGSEYENVDAKVLSMLKQELSAQNVQINEGGNIFYDAESLKQGTEIGNILFVEQKGQSIYDEISNELNLAKEQNNHILGVVVLV